MLRGAAKIKSCLDNLGPPYGSAPRTRGTGRGDHASFDALRFTPVHTGKAPSPGWASTRRPVHPRAYGEEEYAACY